MVGSMVGSASVSGSYSLRRSKGRSSIRSCPAFGGLIGRGVVYVGMVSVDLSGVDEAEYDEGETGIPRSSAVEQILYKENGEWKGTAALGTEFNQFVLEHGEEELPDSAQVERIEAVDLDSEDGLFGLVVYLSGLGAGMPVDMEDEYTTWVPEGFSTYEGFRIGLRPV